MSNSAAGLAASRAPLYGLLHVTDDASHTNLKAKAGDPIDIYLLCSALCAASVAHNGGTFALITNDARRLHDRCRELEITNLDLIEHSFKWPVVEGIAFYSAHFKLELIQSFAVGEFGATAGLIDIDTVLMKPLDLPDLTPRSLITYDITDFEAAAYGAQRLREDLEAVAGRPLREARWYGGEFLIGDVAGFAFLSKEIQKCWSNYVAAIGRLHHVGDEMIVSAAINLAVEAGLPVANADAAGGVARWWSSRTRGPFPAFSQFQNRSLLHLPSDKDFLASVPRHHFDSSVFLASYRKYVGGKLLKRRIINVVSNLFGRERRYVAKLG